MSPLTRHSMRLSVRSVLILIAAFTAIPTAFAQGNPVKFISAVEVPSDVAAGNGRFVSGGYSAVAGYFNSDRRLDVVLSGQSPINLSYTRDIALN